MKSERRRKPFLNNQKKKNNRKIWEKLQLKHWVHVKSVTMSVCEMCLCENVGVGVLVYLYVLCVMRNVCNLNLIMCVCFFFILNTESADCASKCVYVFLIVFYIDQWFSVVGKSFRPYLFHGWWWDTITRFIRSTRRWWSTCSSYTPV